MTSSVTNPPLTRVKMLPTPNRSISTPDWLSRVQNFPLHSSMRTTLKTKPGYFLDASAAFGPWTFRVRVVNC